MSTVSRDLGSVTAYASAVEGGYGGSYEQFCADMANISESSGMIPGIIGAIPIETASGDIVAFDDGAGDAPVHKLSVQMNPKQDFNGYGSAWADGCGKNLLNQSLYVTNSGHTAVTFGQTVGYGTPSVPMKAGTYTFSAVYKNGASSRGYMRKEGDSSNTLLWEVGSDHATFTLAEDMLCSFWLYNSAGVERENVDVQIESGSSATDFVPYRNVSQITGYTDVTVTRMGKNIVEIPTGTYRGVTITRNDDGSYQINGTTTNSVDIICFNYNNDLSQCPFRGNYKIVISGDMTVTGNGGFYASDLSVTRIMSYRTSGTYETSNGIGRMWLYFPKNVTVSGNAVKIMAYLADMDDEFEPYTSATYPITIPTTAGTVYGGEITVNEDGTGVLTVDKGHWQPTSSTGTGTMSQSANGNRCGYACDFSVPSNTANIICSCGTPDTNVNSGNNSNWVVGHCALYHGTQGVDYFRFIFPTTITTAADGLQYLIDNDCEVVYDLTNPIIYNLTAPQVKTLLGNNVMWADSGAMSVDYRANIGMYFEKRENKTRQIIAGVETTDKATKNYYAGDMMIVGDSLCIATTAISSGATFVVGSNIIETTVAEQLLLLSNL